MTELSTGPEGLGGDDFRRPPLVDGLAACAADRNAACACLLLALTISGCPTPVRERTAALSARPYPECTDGVSTRDVLGTGVLRAGPVMREPSVIERFELARRGCHFVFTGREDWALGTTEVEIVYDAELRPIRVWKRSTAPGPQPIARRTDVRAYDLRGARVEMTRRSPTAELEHFFVGRTIPAVVIAPGRGMLTAWLRRAHLSVGGRVREPVLDVRESIERVRDVTLERHDDRDDAALGRLVRVYTIFGREPIFADENDVVVGDLMGMVPASLVARPEPPLPPTDGLPDPTRAP